MTKNNMHWGVIATATLTIAGAMVSPQAMAKHHGKAHAAAATEAYAAPSTNSRVDALEAQLQAMQSELSSLRAAQSRPSAESAKVQELDEWAQSVKAKPYKSASKDNMVYFRGGFAHNDQHMPATTNTVNGSHGPLTLSDRDGWNFGAGFDFSLDDNLFGLMKNTELLAELDVDYAEFGNFTGGIAGNALGTGTAQATQSQLRLTAAPKIKFFKGNKLRPWVIPAGFTLNVMSPPSQLNTITELMPAMHFGGGVDYNIWKSLYVGTDVRYNWAFNKLDGTNTNGLTAGGYLGFGF